MRKPTKPSITLPQMMKPITEAEFYRLRGGRGAKVTGTAAIAPFGFLHRTVVGGRGDEPTYVPYFDYGNGVYLKCSLPMTKKEFSDFMPRRKQVA